MGDGVDVPRRHGVTTRDPMALARRLVVASLAIGARLGTQPCPAVERAQCVAEDDRPGTRVPREPIA